MFYRNYKEILKGRLDHGHRYSMKKGLGELTDILNMLKRIRTIITACRCILGYHPDKYKRIYTPVRRTDEMISTAVDRAEAAHYRCEILYSKAKKMRKED